MDNSDTNDYMSSVFYVPSLASGIAFVIVFSAFLAVHLLTSLKFFRPITFIYWFLGLISEIIAYSGRIWVVKSNGLNSNAFIMEAVCTPLGPSFFLIALYKTSALIFPIFGTQFLPFNSENVAKTLLLANIASGALQGAGGGIITNYDSPTVEGNKGVQLIIAGLALQLAILIIFQARWYFFVTRVFKTMKMYGDSHFNQEYTTVRNRNYIYYFLGTFSTALIFLSVRCIYRLIEYSNGLLSKLATREIYFNLLDGMMVALACFAISILPPHVVFGDCEINRKSTFSRKDML